MKAKSQFWSGRPNSNRGPLAPKISSTLLNTCVSNAPAAQREQTPEGSVPKLFRPERDDSRTAGPDTARTDLLPKVSVNLVSPLSANTGELERVTREFAAVLRRD